jgi:hypothetical protein
MVDAECRSGAAQGNLTIGVVRPIKSRVGRDDID